MKMRVLVTRSQNPQSEIRNPKFLGLICAMVFALCSLLLAPCSSAQVQQAKVPKIGLLSLRGSGYESFQRELRKLGYIEGKNIVIEFRSADNKLDRLPALAHELVRLNVDVLFTRSTTDALAAKNATRTIPIVFISGSGDPVEPGWLTAWRGLGKPHGVHHHSADVGRQAIGVTQGNRSKALPRCGVVGPTG